MDYPEIRELVEVSLDQLLLDPNNYRFLDMDEYVRAQESRYHEETVQGHTLQLLRADGADDLRALKESIQANGYMPLDTLVVRPYDSPEEANLYVVVEGNRRVAAMKWLLQDKRHGLPVDDEVLQSFETISALRIEAGTQDEKLFQHVLLGMRHVSGIKEWGGFQRAKIILEMVDDYGNEVADAAQRLGMTTYEAMRRYRAIKALQQMKEDEEFGPAASPDMYRLFHEAVSVRAVKDWLNWDDDNYRFTNHNRLKEFYRMLVPHDPDDWEEGRNSEEPKIRTYRDVRNLREILGNEEAKQVLLDPQQTFSDALAVAKAAEGTNWLPKVRAADKAMNRLEIDELKSLSKEEVRPLQALANLITERLDDWEKLTGKKLE